MGLSEGELGKDVLGEVAGDEPDGVEEDATEEGEVDVVISSCLVA